MPYNFNPFTSNFDYFPNGIDGGALVAAPWVPSDLAGLLFWLRPGVGITNTASGDNVLVNGDFESPLATGWAAQGAPTTFERSTDIVHGGTYSLHLVCAQNESGYSNPPITGLTTGMTLKLDFWYYLVSGKIDTYMSNVNQKGMSQSDLVSGAWTRQTEYVGLTSTSTHVAFYAKDGPAEYYIDDATISAVESVETWEDQSGNGNDFTQSTAGRKPIYELSQVNGYPALRTYRRDIDYGKHLSTATLSISQPFTLFLVIKPNYLGTLDADDKVIKDNNNYYQSFHAAGGGTWSWWTGQYQTVLMNPQSTDWCLLATIWNGASSYLYQNGTLLMNGVNMGANGLTAPWSIGGLNQWASMQILEAFAFDTAISSVNMDLAESYISSTYGIF